MSSRRASKPQPIELPDLEVGNMGAIQAPATSGRADARLAPDAGRAHDQVREIRAADGQSVDDSDDIANGPCSDALGNTQTKNGSPLTH